MYNLTENQENQIRDVIEIVLKINQLGNTFFFSYSPHTQQMDVRGFYGNTYLGTPDFNEYGYLDHGDISCIIMINKLKKIHSKLSKYL